MKRVTQAYANLKQTILLFLLSGVIFAMLICVLCACKDKSTKPHEPYTPAHNHYYDSVVATVPSICTQQGSEVRQCSCGDRIVVSLPFADHDYDRTHCSKIEEVGHYYKCSNCNSEILEVHQFVNVKCPDGYGVEATCYQEGHQDLQCEVCLEIYHTTTPKTDEHNFSEQWSHNATHHWRKCVNGDGLCDATQDEQQHQFVTTRKEPTCTEAGYEYSVCECGAVKEDSEIILEPQHNLTYFPATPATNDIEGNIEYWLCVVCNKYFSSENCDRELDEEDVFIPVTHANVVETIQELKEIAYRDYAESVSADLYEITLTVWQASALSNYLLLYDVNGDYLTVYFDGSVVDLSCITAGDTVTVRGYLFAEELDVTLLNAEIVDVISGVRYVSILNNFCVDFLFPPELRNKQK